MAIPRPPKLVEQGAVGRFDADAVAGWSGIAAGTAVDIRANSGSHEACSGAAGDGTGTKYRIRVQLSHWMRLSLRRAWLKTCGRSRT